jgi:peptide/nickel transport system permease protein
LIRYAVARIGLAIPAFLGAVLLIFVAGHYAPGDPVQVMLGDRFDPVTAAQLRRTLGLDRPLPAQFVSYLAGLATLDFGTSYVNPGRHVGDIVRRSFPISLSLAALAVALASIVGCTLGIAAAIAARSAVDRLIQILVVVGLSVPRFVVAAILVLIFALAWRILPVAGWGTFPDYILPVLVLALPPLAFITRITRTSVVQVMGEDYVRTAWSKGLTPRTVLIRHVFRNAALPIVTTIGMAFSYAVVGGFVVEVIFNIPGIARVAVNAILQRDYVVLQTIVLLYTALFTAVNLAVDISYAFVNPRIRY